MRDRIPFRVHPMLATLVGKPFHKPGWVYEEKYDGYRILAYKEAGKVTLLSRNDKDRSLMFPGIAAAVRALPARTLLLDGEVVAFDGHDVSRFQLLQQGKIKPKFAVFDCLYLDGEDLRSQPLSSRRSALETSVRDNKQMLLSRRLAQNGIAAYRIAKARGFEGLVAKDQSSPYVERRSTKWLKVKVHQEEEFVIAGHTAPEGSRQHFGALLLGAYDRRRLVYVGKVGTGFSRQTLESLARVFKPLILKKPALVDPPPERNVTWLKPKLVAQVAFQEWTADNKLRQPVYLGLRDDKKPEECLLTRVRS